MDRSAWQWHCERNDGSIGVAVDCTQYGLALSEGLLRAATVGHGAVNLRQAAWAELGPNLRLVEPPPSKPASADCSTVSLVL